MKKHIDDIFKDKLDQFEAPVSDGLWDKIQQNPGWQQHLRQQKIRNLSIYAVLAVIVISSCAILLHQRNNIDNQAVEPQQMEEDSLITTPQEVNTTPLSSTDPMMPEATTDEAATAANPDPEATAAPATQTAIEMANPTEDNAGVVNPVLTEPSTPQNNAASSEKASEKSTFNTEQAQPNKHSNKSEQNNTPSNNEPATTHNASGNENSNSSLFTIPNAFTPNGDGLNDVFKPVTAASLQQYQLDIFAVSGQHIFTSRSIDYGWNGEFQGSIMNSGNYIYIIKYKDNSGKEHIDKGQLLLIR